MLHSLIGGLYLKLAARSLPGQPRVTSRFLPALSLTLACACGGAAVTPPDGGPLAADGGPDGGNVTAPAGALSVHVNQARRASTGPLELNLTLANGSGSPAEPLNPELFQLATNDGLLHSVTLGTFEWIDGDACDATVSLTGGASTSCNLLFNITSSATPVSLTYRTPNALVGVGADQRTATSPAFTLEACTACGSSCTYLDRDAANCGACGTASVSTVNGQSTICRGGTSVCATSSLALCDFRGDYSCVDLQTNPTNCGACGVLATSGTCQGGKLVCAAGETICPAGAQGSSPYCANLMTDFHNCGTCGTSAPPWAICIAGAPGCATGLTHCPAETLSFDGYTHTFAEACTNLTTGGPQACAGNCYQQCGSCDHINANIGNRISCVGAAPVCPVNDGTTVDSQLAGSLTVYECN